MALPTTGLTAHYDASSADDLFKTFVSGGPHTGTPVDGDSVAVWDHEAGAARILKQFSTDPLPVWRQATPLLPLPCLDFTGGQRLTLTNHAGTAQALSTLIANNAHTVLVAFYAESITIDAGNDYQNHVLIADLTGFWGLFLQLFGGVPKVTAYNYDGTQDYVRLDVTAGAPHVAMMRHQGGSLYLSLDGGAESSIASGNTTNLTSTVHVGAVNVASSHFNGRIGEIAVYNTALTGTDLTDAVIYFTSKWLAAAAVERADTYVWGPL